MISGGTVVLSIPIFDTERGFLLCVQEAAPPVRLSSPAIKLGCSTESVRVGLSIVRLQ